MSPADLPCFVVGVIVENRCNGRFDPSPWVGDGWGGVLYLGGGRFLWGRFGAIDAAAHTCTFTPDHLAELSALRPNESYPYTGGWEGERAELVLDEARRWERRAFKPSDMVRFPSSNGSWMATQATSTAPSGGQVVPGGWDHEHCEICSQKIGLGGEPEGYFSEPDTWVCQECYRDYVAPRSLAFVNGFGTSQP